MSKDEAIGRLVKLVAQCDTAFVVRLCEEVEGNLEPGPYGMPDPRQWLERHPRPASSRESKQAPVAAVHA